jgi:hypothetical protein
MAQFLCAAEGEAYMRDALGGTKGSPISTSQGLRYPDAVNAGEMTEVKVGYLNYNTRNITQIEKDIEIVRLQLGGITSGDYQFLRSALTDGVGADSRLLQMIEDGGLNYTINSGAGILAPTFSEAGLFGTGIGLSLGGNNSSGVTLSKH